MLESESFGIPPVGFSAGGASVTWPLVSMMTDPSLNATDLRCLVSIS